MIKVLPPLVSSRLAAGEVIERPSSVVRELIDNAIDAESSDISVTIENGGIDLIKVRDNGKGMDKDDLSVIATSHATSKITCIDDLYSLSTMGFRGEALSSISSVSKTTIRSAKDGKAFSVTIDNGKRGRIIEEGLSEGTMVSCEDLFLSLPARRAFLKRGQSEARSVKSVIISKALAHPSVRFTLYQDKDVKLSFPPRDSLKERAHTFLKSYGIALDEINCFEKDWDDFSISALAVSERHFRSDRREIRVYVNKRPVDDYALENAVLYAYGNLLPGGLFPYALVFINIKPYLVDFNIHPAKKEVKIRGAKEVHHALYSLIKENMERTIPEVKIEKYEESAFSFLKEETSSPYEYQRERTGEEGEEEINEEKKAHSFKYLGQAFNLFLISEKDGNIFFVDQHAAHERILYDEIIGKKDVQMLLFPIPLTPEDENFLSSHIDEYEKYGITIEEKEGVFELTALPSCCRNIEKDVVSFVENNRLDGEALLSKLFAVIACKAAIKAGDSIDRQSAENLLSAVFSLDSPVCPHGRTFVATLSEKELRSLVGRLD